MTELEECMTFDSQAFVNGISELRGTMAKFENVGRRKDRGNGSREPGGICKFGWEESGVYDNDASLLAEHCEL